MPATIDKEGIGKLDREALAGLVENAPYELKRFRFDDEVHVRSIADGVALIAYKVSEEMVIDGKTTTLEHTETLAGDPYGRR